MSSTVDPQENQSNTDTSSNIKPGHHKLHSKFTFLFYIKKSRLSKNDKASFNYESALHDLATFETVEDFWAIYSNLARPESLQKTQCIHLFRTGLRPMWEDNPKGGIFNIKFTKKKENQNLNRAWEDLVLAFIGNQFGKAGEDIEGISYAHKISGDVFSIWTKNAENEEAKKKISDKLKEILNLPPTDNFEYKSNASMIEA